MNVGNLYVSTGRLTEEAINSFEANGTNPLAGAVASEGDIVTLGTLQATAVYLDGNNITLKNGADIKAVNNDVTIRAAGDIEIGRKSGDPKAAFAAGLNNAKDFILINDFSELKSMTQNTNYMLAKDIDAKGERWDGIRGHFYGIFDGLNHKISNLRIGIEQENSRSSHIGLFGDLHGTVKNLGIVDCKIYGAEDVGSVVGYMYEKALVDNCYTVGGEIYGVEFVGGLVGTAHGGTVKNSESNSKVYGWNCVGGIVGISDTYDFFLINCHNTGDVECYFDDGYSKGAPYYADKERYFNSFTGGLIGSAHAGFSDAVCTIAGSFNSGYVKGTTNVGGLTGVYDGNGTITGSQNYGTVEGINNVGGLVGYSAAAVVQNCLNSGIVISKEENAGLLVGDGIEGAVKDNIKGNTNRSIMIIGNKGSIELAGAAVRNSGYANYLELNNTNAPEKQLLGMVEAVRDAVRTAAAVQQDENNNLYPAGNSRGIVRETIRKATDDGTVPAGPMKLSGEEEEKKEENAG